MAYLIDFETREACFISPFVLDHGFLEASTYDKQRIIANGNRLAGIEAKE